jgi:type II secretory ATPase GspE/PulE/Tfp pilus assembly ATPase PilB-like protein
MEMGLEPYQLTSALFGVVAQRLLRRLKPAASQATGQTSYQGRLPVAEFVVMDEPLRRAILNRDDASAMAKIYAAQESFRPMSDVAVDVIKAGATDEAEVRRVLGSGG